MKNKVIAHVAGHDFTILSEEEEGYVQRVAAQVDREITTIQAAAHLSLAHAAVLAALNFADQAQKSVDSADHLRGQLREYLDESSRIKTELAEARREISRLRNPVR